MKKTKQLCPNCETGKRDYELDNKSDMCTYISCFKNGMCSHFVSLNGDRSVEIISKVQ